MNKLHREQSDTVFPGGLRQE